MDANDVQVPMSDLLSADLRGKLERQHVGLVIFGAPAFFPLWQVWKVASVRQTGDFL